MVFALCCTHEGVQPDSGCRQIPSSALPREALLCDHCARRPGLRTLDPHPLHAAGSALPGGPAAARLPVPIRCVTLTSTPLCAPAGALGGCQPRLFAVTAGLPFVPVVQAGAPPPPSMEAHWPIFPPSVPPQRLPTDPPSCLQLARPRLAGQPASSQHAWSAKARELAALGPQIVNATRRGLTCGGRAEPVTGTAHCPRSCYTCLHGRGLEPMLVWIQFDALPAKGN